MSAAVWTVEVVPDSTWCSWFSSRWCSSGEQQYVCNVCRILQWITLLLYNQQPKFVRDISDTLTQINKKKVNWSHYRPGVAQRVGRGIALLFHDCSTGRGCGQQHGPDALYPQERPGIHFTGGWVGPRAGLDGRKISFPPGFDPGPSSP